MNLEDLCPVLTELFPVKQKWFNIGIQLSLPVKELQKIFADYKNDHNTGLRLMLIMWLETGQANWKTLCRALNSQIVEESTLAKKLQRKYCNTTGLGGNGRPSISKGTKRAQPEESSVPNTKRLKCELPSSFPLEDFVRSQPNNRLCSKCRRIPRIPVHPMCCSHKVYCEPCSQKTKICLTHRQDITYTIDKDLQANICRLQIHCPNRQRGCDFKNELNIVYKEHVHTCTKQRTRSRPHNIQIQSADNAGEGEDIGTPTTPSTPSSTPTNLNVPSPMMKQLMSPVDSSVPGSLMVTQRPKEKPTLACPSTNQQTLTNEILASSQMRQQLPLPLVAGTISLMAQEPSPVTSCIGSTTETLEPNIQYQPVSVSAGTSTFSQPNVTKQVVTPTSKVQISGKPPPITTPAPWLSDQKTLSATITASKVPTEQPSKSVEPKYLANAPVVHSADIQHTTTPTQLVKTSVSQQSTMSPLTVQQTLTTLGIPLPLHWPIANLRVPINISTAVSSQSAPVLIQNGAKPSEKQTVVGTIATRVPTHSKPQQSIVSKTKTSQNGDGTKLERLLINPTIPNKLPPVGITNNCALQGGVVKAQNVLPKSQMLESASCCPITSANSSSSTKGVTTTVNTTQVCKISSMKCGKKSSQQAELPFCSDISSMTSINHGNIQTATSSARSATQQNLIPHVSTPANRVLTFSKSVTTSPKRNKGVLQTTPFSFSNTCIVQSAPVSSTGVEPKVLEKVNSPTSTRKLTAVSSSQKEVVNTIQSFPCTVCQLTPRNPLRSECCGVLYCEPCSKKTDKCPQHLCQFKFKRDVGLFNLIQKQETKCKYVGNGCTWTGLVAEQWEHIAMCQFNPSKSPLKSCLKVKEKDSLSSPRTSKLSDGSTDIEQQLSMPKVTEYQLCKYAAIGCVEHVPPGKMKLHLQEAVQHHLDLAIKRILVDEMKEQ